MKKIVLSFAAVAFMFSTQAVSAQVAEAEVKTEVAVEETVNAQEEWKVIESTELPAEVQQAFERDYEGVVISEAAVNEKDGVKEYRLKVTTAEGEEKELYSDALGTWIDKEEEQK